MDEIYYNSSEFFGYCTVLGTLTSKSGKDFLILDVKRLLRKDGTGSFASEALNPAGIAVLPAKYANSLDDTE